MQIVLVPWLLLLFGVNLNWGHYIRDLEYGPVVLIESSGVNYVNPKPRELTLRDILYYHIIERPKEEPVVTEHAFTNSHGYQFLEPESSDDEYDEHEVGYDENDQQDENAEFIGKGEDTEIQEEEDSERTTEPNPLTDADVKEAYKAKSYLFDQMRQRYAAKRMAEFNSLNRMKRQAEMQAIPDAPSLSNKDAYVLPKTYGMNLNQDGGYVWNNLNKPPSYYELGPSNGNSSEGQAQSQENTPLPSETAYIPPETSDPGSSEDIYVNTYRPSAIPLETEAEKTNSEMVNDNLEPINENPESDSVANYPVETILGNDEAESNEGIANDSKGPEVYDKPEPSYPVEPIIDNSKPIENSNTQEAEVPQSETPISGSPVETVQESNENPGFGYGQSQLEGSKPESSPEENPEGEKIKEIPEAPTLPPLNYDNLPDYIPDAISSTEKPGQYTSAQSQGNLPPPSETTYTPPGTSDSGSSEDIYVNTYRPSAIPLETEPEKTNSETVNDNPEPININPESDSVANYPVEQILGNDEAESNEGIANDSKGPEVYEKPEPSYPVEPIVDNSKPIESADTQETDVPQSETPISGSPVETVEEANENPGYGYGQSQLEGSKPENTSEGSSEGEKIKEIPEAPTLPPLNYDNLPDYIRDAISSTEKTASYEQTDNPYTNPQPSPDDKKVMEDKMQDIFATMPPVEDIPKTYGMNLTSGVGHVWNDMVNPPVSYDVGSPSNPEEEHKEEQTQVPITEQPEIHKEPENPTPEPPKPEQEEPISNPDEPNKEETYESEEAKNPIEEPIPNQKPEKEVEPEAPISDPNSELPKPENEAEPQITENEDKPIEESAQPVEPLEPELPGKPEIPEVMPEPGNEDNHEIEKPEEPISDPNIELPKPENEPEPQTTESQDKPIEEPAQPVETLEPESTVKPENPEVIPEPGNEDNHEIEETEQLDVEEEDHIEGTEKPVEKPEGNNKPDIMNELLKSEQFWKWLGEWTATYMELLEKHIRKIAIQEICNREKAGEKMCPLEENPKETGVIIKDGKVIVDGREIDMTHTDNLDSELKDRHKNKHENKGSNGNKVEASTIYGNSVGNEKVTNVFIFTADKTEEVIDKLKPANDSQVDFVIDDRIKEENKSEPNKEKSVEDESNVEDTNIDAPNKESNEEAVNKEETDKEEANKESNEGDATLEAVKEPTEGEGNKESDVSEASTEELNNEDDKKSNEGVNKEESKKSDSKSKIDEEDIKDEEPKVTSGDIGEDDEEDNNDKQDSSEKNKSNSKEYLEKK